MSVRKATSRDVNELNYLLKKLWEEKPSYMRDINDASELLNDEKAKVFVAESNGNLYGFLVAYRENDKNKIVMVYVLPDRRNHGYGLKLTEYAVNYLEGCIEACVSPFNEDMIRILKKLEFICEDPGDEDYGTRLAKWRLIKKDKSK